ERSSSPWSPSPQLSTPSPVIDVFPSRRGAQQTCIRHRYAAAGMTTPTACEPLYRHCTPETRLIHVCGSQLCRLHSITSVPRQVRCPTVSDRLGRQCCRALVHKQDVVRYCGSPSRGCRRSTAIAPRPVLTPANRNDRNCGRSAL